MNTFDLGRILEEVHWEEYAEFDNPPHRIRSLHHRLRMRSIMNRAVERHDEPVQRTRMKLSPRKVLILLVLIFTAIITAAAIIVWYGNIYGQRHSDNTELFAVVEGAPDVIEEVYELTEIPEGFELVYNWGSIGDEHIYRRYENKKDFLLYEQVTRRWFRNNNDIDRTNIIETDLNGQKSLLWSDGKNTIIYMDVEKYIIKIYTSLSSTKIINFLKISCSQTFL